VSAANRPAYGTDPLDAPSTRGIAGDGAMGTQMEAVGLSLDEFNPLEGCDEILNGTRSDAVETKYVRLQTG